MQKLEIVKIDWDSEFWGFDIYNINQSTEYRTDKIKLELPRGKSKYLIQELVSVNQVDYINELEDFGFRFVESKINFVKKVRDEKNMYEKDAIKSITSEELNKYRNEFVGLYSKVSRYLFFGESKVNQFYYTWVDESIKGRLDNGCVGYYIDNELVAFITYKLKSKKLIIGLVGVFQHFQGKKISQQLLNYINDFALANNCSEIYVATQGKNTRAINAYIKNGFHIDGIENWYYLSSEKGYV